ncbi:MAG: hypothetical protein A2498_04300 [Lentisphaerae bacterium RIFOXYC12_FULL_60_16]|nr:MAG: hypothetical protein A2498_04300 [Lentisphaerae bacterium RIFOXYC12_FULL_60_16]OGV75128.1 MAG: hypothetical protein A2340_05740 [Lentisphaerae bacterium RIFOXYB12_FULL_60_10]
MAIRILRRYVLRELLAVFAYCATGFILIHLVFDLFSSLPRILNNQPHWQQVARYYLSYVAPALELLIPAALMLATLYTLWQLSRHHELVAMRASGINLWTISGVFIKVGLVISLMMVLARETVIPPAALWAHQFKNRGFTEEPEETTEPLSYANSMVNRQWLIDAFSPHQPGQLRDVKVTQERHDGTRQTVISAPLAEWLDGAWWFYRPTIRHFNEQDAPLGGKQTEAPIDTILEIPYLTETPDDLLAEKRPWELLSASMMAHYLQSHQHLSAATLAERTTDFHARLAMPWTSLIVLFFAIPLGAQTGRQSILSGIIVALACFFGFYALFQVGIFMGKSQLVQPWIGAWLSNVVFLTIGAGMALHTR